MAEPFRFEHTSAITLDTVCGKAGGPYADLQLAALGWDVASKSLSITTKDNTTTSYVTNMDQNDGIQTVSYVRDALDYHEYAQAIAVTKCRVHEDDVNVDTDVTGTSADTDTDAETCANVECDIEWHGESLLDCSSTSTPIYWDCARSGGSTSLYSLATGLTHELGHALAFEDLPGDPTSAMNNQLTTGYYRPAPSAQDIQATQFIYGP